MFTTIPASISTPIRDITERGVPVMKSPMDTPIMDMGTVKIMMKGSRRDSNWLAITM